MKAICKLTLLTVLSSCSLALATPSTAGKPSVVLEAATRLPLAYDVDVVVAGGSLAGVEAACAAADQGATVLLTESRPYLGYDLCASQKLWLDTNETPETSLTRQLFQERRVVTPLEVKRALDDALLDHNVQFLTGTFPAELLVTEDGAPGGFTIVSRSGRQAIQAKVIIDATPDAMLTRQSAAEFEPFKPGPKQCRFTVVGGELRNKADVMTGRQVAGVFYEPSHMARLGPGDKKKWGLVTKRYPVFEYNLPLQHDSDTFRARSKALNHARSLVYHAEMVDQSEHLLYFPDKTIIPAVSTGRYTPNGCPLGLFRPRGIENLYVLSAYAGGRWSPCNFARIGRRIGAEAAKRAKQLPRPKGLNYSAATTGNRDRIVVEVAPSFRFRHCPKLKLADHDLAVLGRWDVVVVGGGTSGAPAAVGAARSGARTLVIEYLDELGGVGTAGLISKYWYGRRTGFTAEVDEHLGATNGQWNPVHKAEWLRAELMKLDAEVWFGSFGCGSVMKGNKVTGVVVATPFGRGVVLADVVIDATGNADIAAAAGAGTHYSISALGDLSVQVAGYPCRDLGQHHNNTAYTMVSDCDVFDRWHLLLSARKAGAGWGTPYDMGQLIDTRDRRRIIGDYILATEDILTQRTFPDTISHHKSNFDAGALPDAEMFLVKDMKGPVYTCDMPYRCLTPRGVEGLLVTGLGASTHRDAMTLTRMQADLQNQGYAAGMAAAMAAGRAGGLVREIDLKELQKALVENGCLEERVLTDRDSFPMSEESLRKAVETLHSLTIDVHQKREYDDTLPALAMVMGNPEQSIPLLKTAYRKADKPETKINFARILAVLGDGAGKETLLGAVNDAKDWGQGWDFSSQREHANSFGEVDRLVVALGFLRTPEVRPSLIRKLEALTAQSPLSHYKAVCLALRLNKDSSLAQPLARLLDKEGVKGHVQPLDYYAASGAGGKRQERHRVNSGGGDLLNSKFKEVLVAALLFECGDHNGQAREVLEAYTTDVNGHFASYAHFVLTRGTAMKRP